MFRRIALLGTFAALGAGLAVALVCSAPSARRDHPREPSVATAPTAPRVIPSAIAADHTAPSSAGPALPAPVPVLAMIAAPAAPIAAELFSEPAQQFIPTAAVESERESRLLEALDQLVERLGQPGAPPALAAVSREPAAAPEAGAMVGESPEPPPPALMPVPAAPERSAPIIRGEGDEMSLNIQNNDIREVLEFLSERGNLNILASKNVQGTVSATLTGVDIDTALEGILRSTGFLARREGKFVYVGTAEDFASMEQALDQLGTRIYRPNYVAAAELEALIKPLVTEKVGLVSVSAPAEVGIASNVDEAGGNKFAGGETVLVRDYEAVLAQIDQVVAEIDKRPLQVAIEATILSVKLDNENSLGIDFAYLSDQHNLKLTVGTPAGALPPTPGGGLEFAFIEGGLGAFIDALETTNDTDVIATPRLMVLNKHRAEIQIGKQQGYVNTTITETSASQSVEFLDTGTILRLRPFISSDGLIRLEVHPELSTGEVTEKAGVTVPEKDVTQVTTNIMVRDGCTVVIGGLMRDELVSDIDQIPYLGGLPWVGALFRHRSETTQKHEILVLITPRIVYEPETCLEGSGEICRAQERHAEFAANMSPFGRQSVSRRYCRIARNAWQRGNCATARRFVDLAVRFDPACEDAKSLERVINGRAAPGEEIVSADPSPAPPDASVPGGEIAPWMLDELGSQAPPAPAVEHPLDPGVPGAVEESSAEEFPMIGARSSAWTGMFVAAAALAAGCASLEQVDRAIRSPRELSCRRAEAGPPRDERERGRWEQVEAARSLWTAGEAPRAIARLEQLTAHEPDNLQARLLLGEILLTETRVSDALATLRPAAAAHPKHAEAQYLFGLALDAAGQRNEAAHFYQLAAQLDPENEVYSVSYRAAIAKDATAQSPVVSAARETVSARVPAISDGLPIASDRPASPTFTTSQPQMESPRPSAASRPAESQRPVVQPIVSFLPAALDPDIRGRRTAAAETVHAGYTAPAEDDGAMPLAQSPGNAALAAQLPQVAPPALAEPRHLQPIVKAADEQAALARLRAAAEAHPGDFEVIVAAAVAALKCNRPDIAIEMAEPAVAAHPASAALQRTLATAYYRQGDYRATRATLERALALDKSHALAYFLMGCTLKKLGEMEAAEAHLRQARTLDPRYAAAR